MYLKKLQLINFKRFSNVTIDLSNQTTPPKLVLLIGENGSGRTSIFDAFEWVTQLKKGRWFEDDDYYKKDKEAPLEVIIDFTNGEGFHRKDNSFLKDIPGNNIFYGRSSLRQVPKLTRTGQGVNVDISNDSDRPRQYTLRDERFENDIDYLTQVILEEVFTGSDFDSKKLKEDYINPLNDALHRIFGDKPDTSLKLIALLPPLRGKVADIRFKKGQSEFHYDLLSSGEKEIFNIFLNLFARKKIYNDTIYFIDELDLHLNTSLQYSLLKEITENWIPDNCQLWTASHSLGFIDYARESELAATIDFNQLDFDLPFTLMPQPKESFDVYEVAVSKEVLSKMLTGKKIIFAENKDAFYYNNLNIDNIIFLSANDKRDVFYKSKSLSYFGLIDRDFLTDEEVVQIKGTYNQLYLLNYYSIENYLYHPDNLEEYYRSINQPFDKDVYTNKLTECRNQHKSEIIYGINNARSGYPFYKENEYDNQRKEFVAGGRKIIELIESDDFETFYKVLPMKELCKDLPERQHINKSQLAQTNWVRTKIKEIAT